MSQSQIIRETFEKNGGIFKLIPTFVPRNNSQPGKRLRLHPDDYFALGTARGPMKERWFSSVIQAANGPLAAPDEGMSYVSYGTTPEEKFLLKDAVAVSYTHLDVYKRQAVKIDAFAYLPVQDFGNAFSIFTAQNYGAKQTERIKKGIRAALTASVAFSLMVSFCVFVFAEPLMTLFINAGETAVIEEGVRYLHIEGAFYFLIGILFLFYGLYRALAKPGMSVVLTIASLGIRVALAYALSAIPAFGIAGIWWSVPIGWLLADVLGTVYYFVKRKSLLRGGL